MEHRKAEMQKARERASGIRRAVAPFLLFCVSAFLFFPTGCRSANRLNTISFIARGEYGDGRAYVLENMTQDRSERDYLLDRMALGILLMDDGYAPSAGFVFEDVYDILRTQGINEDKTTSAVVFYEGVKFWKGEPFEQAMAIFYYGLQQASLGQWDNARAAAKASLFRLRDFGEGDDGRINTAQIARRATEYERGEDPDRAKQGDYLDHGYAVRESNFTLGYLLHAIASQQLGRADEANDYYNAALEYNSDLEDTVRFLRQGNYNTIFVVGYGIGPRKVAYGPDGALAQFQPIFQSTPLPLRIRINDLQAIAPVAHDINDMARDHMWNNLEDVRKAKSTVGRVMQTTGAATVGYGVADENATAAAVGAALILAGAAARAGARADTRYCDAIPQRIYIVPAMVQSPADRIELQVEGRADSRMVLTGLAPPRGPTAQLRYVRLVSGMPRGATLAAPQWATSGEIVWSTDGTGPVGDAVYPYIVGGNDVRIPTDTVLGDYRSRGYLQHVLPGDLREWYRAEGITFEREKTGGIAPQHVLEGGSTLVAPLPGTAGFMRLFAQPHPPYQPTSDLVRRARNELNQP